MAFGINEEKKKLKNDYIANLDSHCCDQTDESKKQNSIGM